MKIIHECPTCERPVEIFTEREPDGDLERMWGTLSCPCGDNFDVAFDIERDSNGIVEHVELMRCTPTVPRIQDFIVQDFPDPMPDPDADWHEASREAARDRRAW